jgi:hypothetical protein
MWVELVGALLAIAAGIALALALAKPGGAIHFLNVVTNWIQGALSAAVPILKTVEADLAPIVAAFVAAFIRDGGAIAGEISPAVEKLVKTEFEISVGNLVAGGESKPDNAMDQAAAALAAAFGFGIASAGVTAAFEAAFPEKLNVLNSVGPTLAKLAGYDEVSAAIREPLYDAAFGRSAQYYFNSVFKPEFPNEKDAVEWHSRRLDKGWKLEDVFAVSGLKSQFEEAYIQSAYRPISVRSLIRAFVDVPLPIAQLRDTMEFTGNRPQDIDLMISAMQLQSVSTLRSQYISAVMTSAERGTLTTQEVSDAIAQSGQITDATQLAQLTIAVRKLEQLAEIYRKSITEKYTTGQITDAEYLPQLEAIGIAQADAEAHYAVDSIKVRGKQLSAEARAASRAAAALQRAKIQAALAVFRSS